MPYTDPQRQRAWEAANADKRRESNRARYQANKAKIDEQHRVYNQTHAVEMRAYSKAYNAGRKDQQQTYQRTYRETHRVERRVYQRAYHKAHPEVVRASYHRRRAQQAGATRNDLTTAQWKAIKRHYGYRCVYCGRKMQRLTIDHIIPISKGGENTFTNVVPACRTCNNRKYVGPPLVAVQPLLLMPPDEESDHDGSQNNGRF